MSLDITTMNRAAVEHISERAQMDAERHRIHTGMTLALIRAIRKCDPTDGISKLLDNHEAFARDLYQEHNVLTVADHD